MVWSLELRNRCVQRLMSSSSPSLSELSEQTGVSTSTLSRWHTAATQPQICDDLPMAKNKNERRPRDWSPAERLRVVIQSDRLTDEELGEFLRREGLHANTLEQWRQDALAGLDGRGGQSKPARSSRRERALERELRRKERALAETAALLVLQKKSRALFPEDEDDSSSGT